MIGGKSVRLKVGKVTSFMRKLKFVKSKLKDWNKVAFGNLRERKNFILLDLGRIDLIE